MYRPREKAGRPARKARCVLPGRAGGGDEATGRSHFRPVQRSLTCPSDLEDAIRCDVRTHPVSALFALGSPCRGRRRSRQTVDDVGAKGVDQDGREDDPCATLGESVSDYVNLW